MAWCWLSPSAGTSSLERDAEAGGSPVVPGEGETNLVMEESTCLGVQVKVPGRLLVRLNTTVRPIANKYREGKLQSTLKRELKRT